MKKKKEIRLIDKKVLEYVLTEQQEELELRAEEELCHRRQPAAKRMQQRQTTISYPFLAFFAPNVQLLLHVGNSERALGMFN